MIRPYIMVGAGGTGSILYEPLLRYLQSYHEHHDDDFTLTIIDGKEVAASKLHRQLFAGRFAGNPKSTSLVEQSGADPTVVIAVPEYLSEKNIGGIRDGAVVLICADNFPVRARIEEHAKTLDRVAVINGGNEMDDGSLQLYVRHNGEDVTPPMSQGHPEILSDDKRDPAALSCEQIAELPSGEQTIAANMMSAGVMLNGLVLLHQWEDSVDDAGPAIPEEVFWDLRTYGMRATNRPNA